MVTKGDILSAAYRCFSKKGYSMSVQEIAAEVGLKASSLYSHFGSKDEILKLKINQEIEDYIHYHKNVVEKMGDIGVEEALKTIFLSIFQYFNSIERIKFWRNILFIDNEKLLNECKPWIHEIDAMSAEELKSIMEKGIREGILKEDAMKGGLKLYLAMIQGLLDGLLLYSNDIGDYIEDTWETYWSSIKR